MNHVPAALLLNPPICHSYLGAQAMLDPRL